jgi:YegS/Rv2252/BmrU family lipid kinase
MAIFGGLAFGAFMDHLLFKVPACLGRCSFYVRLNSITEEEGTYMSKKDKSIHVKLIANPGAGKVADSADKRKLVIEYLEKHGLIVDAALAKPKEKATSIARRAVKDGFKIVIAMGGDGTIEAVMRGMIGSKARLGIVPAGTENNIAKSLGIPKDLKEACALIASENTLKLDLGQVTTKKGRKFIFFEMATIGLSAAVYPEANKAASGKLSGIKATAMTFIHQETRPKVYLTLDGESKVEVETMLVMVSNTPVFGKNFLVAPGAMLQDGLLDISVYPDFSKVELIRYYAEVMDGGYSGDGKVQHYKARKLKVKADPKLEVMADGVPLGNGTVKIKIRPDALRVITAEKNPGSGIPRKDEAVEIQPMPVSVTVGKNHHEESVISPH